MRTLEHLSFQQIWDFVNSFQVLRENRNMNKWETALSMYHHAHFTANRNVELKDETYLQQLTELVYENMVYLQPNA